MEIDNIYNMDCLEGMKQIPDGTIDAAPSFFEHELSRISHKLSRNYGKE